MPAKLRPRLTYANVTATVAVVLALGGGALAATGRFTGADGKIHGCVSATGRLTVLKPPKTSCAKGKTKISWNSKGPRGLRGLRGRGGLRGPRGPSDAYVGTGLTQGTSPASVSVDVPPGDYLVTGKMWARNFFNNANAGDVECQLTSPDTEHTDNTFATVPNDGDAASSTLKEGFVTVVNHAGIHLPAGGTVTETCTTTATSQETALGFGDGVVSATRVETLHP